MDSDESGPERAPTLDAARVALVVCCLLAVVLAGLLVPALADGVAGSPAASLVPGEALESDAGDEATVEPTGLGDRDIGNVPGGTGGSGFGALNPGSSTGVGGSTGVDNGTYRSQDGAVHFTVTSPEPAYWRTGAYDVYTGNGWEQTGDAAPLEGRIEGDGVRAERLEYEVRLNRSATALPTVWQPTTVAGRSDLRVTDQRAVRSEEPLEPGDTYAAVSHKPPRDPSLLRSSGTDYPAEIERYTRLPEDTPGRIGTFTDELTADAETSYGTARAVERWLEADKEYSLSASRTGEDVADTFIFEMDRGYCEYYATAMVVMLRTQGVPARYAVGYSTGQQVGSDSYAVRAMNAHAWVEVYFEGVGWVKFDPTPGSERLQQERQSLQEQQPDEEYSPQEEGSPGEEFSPAGENGTDGPDEPPEGTVTPSETANETTDGENGSESTNETNTDETSEENQTEGRTESGYDVSLNRTAVPGAAVEVSVTREDEPASGVTVRFNGEAVGQTGGEGTVVGTVPYAAELRVAVDGGNSRHLEPPDGALPDADERFYRLDGVETARDVTVPVETNATVGVTGEVLPGERIAVTATVSNVPVPDAAVLLDGERVATTDNDGRAAVTLPETSGNATIAVERGPVAGERIVSIPDLEVSVVPDGMLALPLGAGTVEVAAGGEPVSAAPVRLGGERVATTGVDGTATVRLPVAASATVTVSAFGLAEEATISGLFLNLGLVVAAALVAVAIPLVAAYRRGYAPRDVLGLLRRLPGLAVQYGQWLLVTLATRSDELLARLAARTRRTVGYLADLLRGRASAAALWARLRAWLAGKRRALGERLGRGSDGTAEIGDRTARGDDPRRSVRAAWAAFLRDVSLPRHRTKTPGEIARHAVDRDGLPAGPVGTLRDAFREVEYGARSAGERLDRVERALSELEHQTGGEGDGEPTGDPQTDGGSNGDGPRPGTGSVPEGSGTSAPRGSDAGEADRSGRSS